MDFNRARVVDENFRKRFAEWPTPFERASTAADEPVAPGAALTRHELLTLLRAQLTSRAIDLVARELRARDEGFYTIGSSGHEGNALVAHYTRPDDLAFLHYRSGAFMMRRAEQLDGQTPIFDTCLSLVASSEDPIAGGRHKVWGSVELGVPPQTSTIASHLPKAIGAAFTLDRAPRDADGQARPEDSIIVCSFGDASLNHSTAQGALNAAAWAAFQKLPLPVLFVCEDNGLGISVETPRGWIAQSTARRPGIGYHHARGTDLLEGARAVRAAVEECRTRRRPVMLHLEVVRLMGHAGSDPEHRYRKLDLIEAVEARDPVLHSAILAVEHGLLAPQEVLALYDELLERVRAAGDEACRRPRHTKVETVIAPLAIDPERLDHRLPEPQRRRRSFNDRLPEDGKPRHMARLLGDALADLMLADERILLFGEDVARKGGVYTITAGLSRRFGLGRVFNTLLDEQTILGVAIGAAQLGLLPIPEIQYLAYLHNAIDQLRGEAGSLQFFSEGRFANPMVVRIASFAYQKGFGGHFHNDNSIASLREIPGIIIAAPSSGADAVRMLRTSVALARAQGKVVVFLEPIALYMQKDLLTPGDGEFVAEYPAPDELAPFGEPGFTGPEDAELLIISYANGHYLSRQAMADLEAEGRRCRLMDLRWLTPLNEPAIAAAAARATHVLVVDEGRRTAGIGEAIITAIVERAGDRMPKLRRVSGVDTYIPLGRAWQFCLPSRESIAAAARELISTPAAEAR